MNYLQVQTIEEDFKNLKLIIRIIYTVWPTRTKYDKSITR